MAIQSDELWGQRGEAMSRSNRRDKDGTQRRGTRWSAILVCLALAGCGEALQVEENVAGGNAEPARSTRPAAVAEPEKENLCVLLSPREIEAALGDRISVAVSRGTETLCDYSIPGEEAGQILFQRMSGKVYDDRRKGYELGNMKPEPVDGLGQDAFMLNDAQIEVRLSDENAFRFSIMLLTRGENPLTREDTRAAITELARTISSRL
jgi:hypothetical protein